MISRLTTFAAAFAILATGALAFTAHAQQRPAAVVAASHQDRVIELPRVVVIAHRLDRTTR